VDVVGGLNIKKQYGEQALAVFIAPPNIDELLNRLKSRGTDTPEMIAKRVDKAEFEMTFAPKFDVVIVNDNLEKAKKEAEATIRKFIQPQVPLASDEAIKEM